MRTLHNIILIIIILSSFLLGASTLTRGHEWGDDFASYIMQAQSIMTGDMDKFIVHNTFTIFESSSQIGPVAYPWGYPLVLTPVLLFKGLHPLTLKLPGLFFFAAFLLCLYLLTEDRISRTERLILVSLFAFNPILIKHLDQILSDIPFLFSVFLASALIAKPTPKNNMRDYILAGVAIFFAFFIRTTGIIILVSFLIYQGYIFLTQQLNRKAIVMKSSIVVATFTLLWFTTSLIFPNGQGAYLRQLMGFTFEIFFTENVPGYFYLGAQFFGISPNTPWIYIYYVVVILFFIGTWSRHNKDLSILLFFIIYLGAMLVWPEWQGIRFVYPILPIFTYFVFQGINALVIKLPQQYRTLSTGAHYLLWLVVVGIFIFNSGTHAFSNLKDNRNINGPFDPHSSEVFNYIKTKTPPDSVIVFFKPRAMRLFTNRDSIMVLECENLLLGDYVVLHKKWEYSQILPNDIPDCNLTLKDVFENQRFIVYQTPK